LKNKYEYQLVGMDKDWKKCEEHQRTAPYTSVPPGTYTFRVRATNNEGVWSKNIASITIKVLPPFWETWTFRISVLLAIVGLIYYLWKKEMTKQAMQQQIIALENKALRAQMNPHFIFNALNSIQALIGTQDEKTARYYLSKFSRLMRQILESSREQIIPLDLEISILENYLSIEQFSHGVKFSWDISCDESLSPSNTGILPMLIHPFVENAVIHGLVPKGAAGHIRIQFSKVENQLIVRVSDNGIGREKARERRSQQDQHHKSTALLVVQERLELLEGKTHIQIIDLTNSDGTSSGTEIKVSLPFTILD
jgi:LytS/YehU family sensor histidine kinase